MKLSDIFGTSIKQTNNKETVYTGNISAEHLNRQIKALVPGTQLQGEIIGKNGNEVTVKLSGDMVLTARLDREVNVEEGQVLTFEVKNNGSTLSLSPLMANTAGADNVLKALQMAALPINRATVEMTEAMMQQGMSIDAKSLQNIFRDVALHMTASPADIVKLHQLGMVVDDNNLAQMENYKNLTHELVRGMTDVVNELPTAFFELVSGNETDKAVQMYQDIINLVIGEGAEQLILSGEQTEAGLSQVQNGLTEETFMYTREGTQEAVSPEAIVIAGMKLSQEQELLQGLEYSKEQTVSSGQDMFQGISTQTEGLSGILSAEETKNLLEMLTALTTSEELSDNGAADNAVGDENATRVQTGSRELQTLNNLIEKLQQGTAKAEDVLKTLAGLKGENIQHGLADVFLSQEFRKLFKDSLIKEWTIKPEQLMEDGKVGEVYQKLLRQLTGVREALESAGAGQSTAAGNAANVSQNIDFMNQMNQMYTYVQLPLKMSEQNANGELYVYTNKRSLAQKDGNVSAFLHLDMENLGPVDVYVAMQNQKVNTRFTVQDDAMLDFLNGHMHILDERLAKKGYSMKWEMSVQEAGAEKVNPVDRILQAEKGVSVMAQYAFDVRA